MNRIAIVGASGQVGDDLVQAINDRPGSEVVTLTRAVVDLDELDAIEPALAEVQFDTLVNCAGYTDVDGAESDAETAFRRNAYAVERLARGCRSADALLVQLSTDFVFDGEQDRPYRPIDPPAPLNVYGASKLAGEALARRAHAGGTLVVRTSSVFGRSAARGNFVETILKLSREQERLSVVAAGAMAPTYTVDLAGALVELVEARAAAGTYHVTNSGQTSWHEFAVAIVRASGADTPVDPASPEHYPRPARRPRFSVLDTERADAIVGSLPPWEDALRRYLADREATQRAPGDGVDSDG